MAWYACSGEPAGGCDNAGVEEVGQAQATAAPDY